MASLNGIRKCFLLFIVIIYSELSHVVESSPLVKHHLAREQKNSQWELVAQINLDGVLPVTKYKSKLTGLTVVFAQAESPIVNGYFCLPTEAYNDDGLPHTLEHLIFLGSEDYPYKEMLDLSANRCLSDRTNAWTATDHTCYTIYSAGSAGFLNILPVYLDHILFPLLRDEGFLTEVHHISGQGEDSGVVYSEMQGTENEASNILYLTMINQIYPGNTSYGWQTGGKLKNLRESTTMEKIRAYHKKFYRPENLYLTITGNIQPEQVFEAIEKIEEKVLSKGVNLEPYERPFQKTLKPLLEDVSTEIKYPSKDEQFGLVAMGWRVPGKIWESMYTLHALRVLAGYMSSSAISPLNKHFVEIDEPLATEISIKVVMNSEAAVTIDFDDVPIESMQLIDVQFKALIQDIIKEGPSFFNMNRIHTIIKRSLLSHKMNMENGPHLVVTDPTVLDMLFSQESSHFELFFQDADEESMKQLLNKTADFWLDLLNQTFTSPRALVLAYPSQEHDNELTVMEADRLKKQAADLGEEGLKKAGEKIAAALESQQLPPEDFLQKIPVADVNSITFKTFSYYNQTSEIQPEAFNLQSIPFSFFLDDMKSQFVRIHFFLDTSKLPSGDIPYLVLLTELWLLSPLKDPETGNVGTLQELVAQRSKNLVSIKNTLGYDGSKFNPGSYSHLIMFYLEATVEKYLEAVASMRDILFHVEFTEERVRTVISQLLNGIPGDKLSASVVVKSLADNMFFKKNNNVHFSSFLRQQKFLNASLNSLKVDPKHMLERLTRIKNSLVRPENCLAFMSTDLDRLQQVVGKNGAEAWQSFFPNATRRNNLLRRETSREIEIIPEYANRNMSPKLRHAIIGLPGSDSCYLKQAVPFNMTDFEDPELPALRVMLQYMTDRLYEKIRGQGWTYGIALSAVIEEGRMSLTFLRASDFNNAFKEFRTIIANYTFTDKNSEEYSKLWDPVLLDSARGSQIYKWAEKEETAEGVAGLSVMNYLRQTADPLYVRRFVKLLARVTLDDVRNAAVKYLPSFLDVRKSQTAIVCNPSEVEVIKYKLSHFDLYLLSIDDLENGILTD